jgi:hypothetical protein
LLAGYAFGYWENMKRLIIDQAKKDRGLPENSAIVYECPNYIELLFRKG